MTNLIVYYAFIIIGELLIIMVLGHMLYKRRTPTSMIAWLLLMILLPYFAIFLYLIFGLRKRENRYKKEHIRLKNRNKSYHPKNPLNEVLTTHGIADISQNEHFELYTDSQRAYEQFMDCIENAKKFIFISTYIFVYDDLTKNILEALIKKAKEGVEIKILMDSLGSIGLYLFDSKLKPLEEAGVEIKFFMPIFEMPFRNYINLRNHRKIYIFDNKKVLSGGMNLSSEYLGANDDPSRWEDILFLVEGSSAELFFEIFASDWFYASQEKLSFEKDTVLSDGDTSVQIVPSGPDMSKDTLYEALLCAIYSAKKRIWIVTPYFVPDTSLVQALLIAKNKGVDVRLITPKESTHLIVDITRSSYMRELEEVGIEVALYDASVLHAKAILFDNTSAMLGSVNIDNRSLFLNYEVATFVYSGRVIKEIELWMNKLRLHSSTGLKHPSAPRRIVENFMRIIAPQL
ncbi:cardiolipin synthase [bacterium]|nr:cardiolipin synthase [bacterium]MBU1990033.1 cardiolipin synthase [bacterium]